MGRAGRAGEGDASASGQNVHVPEGDTIHRSAARLRPALLHQAVVRVQTPGAPGHTPEPGVAVDAVEARGKHLLIRFADGAVLRTHMRMSGSWHLYRTGERWRRPAHQVRALVEVPGWVAVCFSAPVVVWERAPRGALRTSGSPTSGSPTRGLPTKGPDHLGPDHLGPDLCRPDADLDVALGRMARVADANDEIKVVLLDQRVACGVGNVYASEVLFAEAVDPFTPVAELDEATRRRLLSTASRLLRANLRSGPRTTVPGGLAVYGRRGRPCRRCATPVRMRRQGPQARSTYWCPACQPAGPPATDRVS